MYIIDFGLSTLKIGNTWINRIYTRVEDEEGDANMNSGPLLYGDDEMNPPDLNPSHDMRILLTTMYIMHANQIHPKLDSYISQTMASILRYMHLNGGWHDLYFFSLPFNDPTFDPRVIVGHLQSILYNEPVTLRQSAIESTVPMPRPHFGRFYKFARVVQASFQKYQKQYPPPR